MKDKTQAQLAGLTQTRDTLVKLRTALKNKIHNILAAHGVNLEKEALSSEKKLNEILVMQFDAMVKIELEVMVEEIRSLNQRIARLESTIAEEGSKLEGHKDLTSTKGIGPLTGSILLSVIGDINDFEDEGKLTGLFRVSRRRAAQKLWSKQTIIGGHMKTITRTNAYLPIAAMFLTAALAIPAAAQTSCAGLAPNCFKGAFQGQDAHDTLPPGATTVVIWTTATGTGTHLGQFSLIREITGNLVNFSDTGSAQWITANRDSIYTTVVGQAELSDLPGGFLKVTEIHTITGGTGRFTGAQGSFTVELFHKLEASGVAGGVETHDILAHSTGPSFLRTQLIEKTEPRAAKSAGQQEYLTNPSPKRDPTRSSAPSEP